MLMLGIDTSGKTASCALCSGGGILAQYSVVTVNSQSRILMPLVKRMLEDAGVSVEDIDVFAAVNGPGSYTGLRIGIAAVKGICFAAGKKCAGVSSLNALAYNFRGTDSRVCAVMHARQDLVYAALFDTFAGGEVKRLTEDRIVALDELIGILGEYSRDRRIICAGDHAEQTAALYGGEEITAAPPAMNTPLGSSVCFAAADGEIIPPEMLEARYLQVTKAEKDLEER